jgi:predicted MarR family transcription regulator
MSNYNQGIKDEANVSSTNWHLATDDLEAKLSEFEFLLWRLFYSFNKWHEDCQSCVSNDAVSADEIALMHLIRMRDRPKTISEIARLMNRDDLQNIQYSLRKLTSMGIIQKSKKQSKKIVYFEITEKGSKITEKYGRVRRDFIIKLLNNTQLLDWQPIFDTLTKFKNTYDEASRLATLSRTNNNLMD